MITKNGMKSASEVFEKLVGPYTFAMFIRGSRTTLDLSQTEMAKRLGISRSSLCDIESGRVLVTPETAIRYAKKAGFSEVVAVESCLQDLLRRADIPMTVRVEEKARHSR